jgi:hypothetical protein
MCPKFEWTDSWTIYNSEVLCLKKNVLVATHIIYKLLIYDDAGNQNLWARRIYKFSCGVNTMKKIIWWSPGALGFARKWRQCQKIYVQSWLWSDWKVSLQWYCVNNVILCSLVLLQRKCSITLHNFVRCQQFSSVHLLKGGNSLCSSKTLAPTHKTTWQHKLGNHHRHLQGQEYHIFCTIHERSILLHKFTLTQDNLIFLKLYLLHIIITTTDNLTILWVI